MAGARGAGSSDLKMPEPTNTPSAPNCIMRAASAGVAMPPAAKFTTSSRPHRRALADAPERLAQVAAAADEGQLEGALVDVVGLVGGGEDFGLVDVVDA